MKIILALISIGVVCCGVVNTMDVFRFDRIEDVNNNKILDGLCPNNRTKCNSTGTCCKTKHHSYHCCRYKDAVCCPDLFHCCPHGSTCDTEKKRCRRNIDNVAPEEPMEWKIDDTDGTTAQELETLYKPMTLLHSGSYNERLEDEPFCPNNKSRCKATKTCCITKHGNYYCCPHKNAVCCSDKWSCCPEGNTCDIKNKKCIPPTTITKMESILSHELEPTKAISSAIEQFLGLFITVGRHCGNSQKSCPGEKKCCPMTGSNYGCCKYRKGVCCPDFATCCPHDTQCDVKNKVCTAVPDSLVPTTVSTVDTSMTCPDNKTLCSESETCCAVGSVLYGCCPMKDATCCSDKTSCCPSNKKCDVIKRRCLPKDDVVVEQESVKIVEVKTETRKTLMTFLSTIGLKDICPNNSDKCSGGQTCCPIGGNKYGCCPYTKGTCCPDLKSCCPSNTKCNGNGCS